MHTSACATIQLHPQSAPETIIHSLQVEIEKSQNIFHVPEQKRLTCFKKRIAGQHTQVLLPEAYIGTNRSIIGQEPATIRSLFLYNSLEILDGDNH
jgi:hypothetical protein